MEIIVSAAISIDGYLDDCSPQRLKLSSEEDWQEVMELRASCDAILVGAGTVRKDNPSLVIKSEELRAEREKKGLNPDIVKVTLTKSGNIEPDNRFFMAGNGKKIIFAPNTANFGKLNELSHFAEVIYANVIDVAFIIKELSRRGIGRLMVEGGSEVLTMFLSDGNVDVLRLAIAPFFVGDTEAPRLVENGTFVWNRDNRMELVDVRKLGDMAVLTFGSRP